ncbi:DUF6171 family protein [Metabacillus malikii]|uniref:EF-hand domain-containing protein n=1 Tax=Metabacillus malikii TaxID=1504265 RepID=A0ABT9ZC40_9BACI|nr:DUF6171 family protein [Metabacillus malikii]MDQ0229402.1 hypothetical protein [Metabacillus malikii]
MTTKVCKGCSNNVIVKRDEMNHILSKIDIDDNQIVSDEEYANRLNTCNSCESFMYGSTCAHSGCLVEFRAKFSNKLCPSPSGSRW